MDKFAYKPIDLDRPAFRLLHLLKGKWSPIKCTMYQAFLDGPDIIPYDALSYTWGDTHKTSTVIVNREALRVTENLYSALQHLRSENVDKTLWVDAICIDQSNERERGHQVQQMCKIYSQAEEVIVWLGQATRETNVLFESLQRLQEHSFLYGHGHRHWNLAKWKELWLSVPKDSDSELYDGLILLLSRPWFKRVWILQEIANAKKASILCGTKSVRAHTLALAPSLIGIKPERHCQAVLDIMPGQLREETWWSESRDLYNLLLKFKESEASDPRDKVYALLGISSDARDTDSLRPDYTKDLKKVIYDTSSFLFGPSNVYYMTMAALLSNLTSRSVTSFVKLVKTSDVSEVERFLVRRGLEVPLPDDVVKAAATNEEDGQKIMSYLLRQRGQEIFVTDGVIKAAAGNKKNGMEIMKFLYQERRDECIIRAEAIEAAATNEVNGLEIMKFFFQECILRGRITAGMLEAAASNQKDGLEMMILLCQQGAHRCEITEGVLEAAASNQKDGLEIMTLLHQGSGDEFTITKGVIEAARDNTTSGMDIINFLLEKFGYQFSIIVFQELEEALAHDEEARGLLYDENTDSSFRLVRDIVWEAPAEKIYMAIKTLLLYPRVSVDVESGMHDTAPKLDPFKRHKAVLRLLLEPSTSSIAHPSLDPVTLSD
ncbi:hypothetical protein AA0119_g6247 [Alternaria tenuissima]|uniref:Heterokaryon incompatibility domain-containing protein n=1 Tax=Alternaria tenuissima TaxID=119927 RepID=A0ABY0G8Y4_9PLEO|nr:hypothetical protein AA0118_g9374 [Alternaria tenuissima]RYO00132.1 hypothetical protein AA0119_g6247 [Alternaria tenuissima]RYO11705.1 hypothetical protein AA0121_g9643 [Alternaria tenuissima]RYO62237.1 hypothetical protein AA0116_g4220 [Alternaria tenuissima]